MQFPFLTPILKPIQWAAVGAAATRLYMPERMTNDLDILIQRSDAAAARTKFIRAGAIFQGELSIGGSSWLLADGFPVDVIESEDEWTEQALMEAQANLDAQSIPILPLAYLVLMKFRASRVQDLADITRMLGQATQDQLTEVRALFARWMPDEMEDLESLIELGQLEMQTGEQQTGA